jgi:hypothetical protein
VWESTWLRLKWSLFSTRIGILKMMFRLWRGRIESDKLKRSRYLDWSPSNLMRPRCSKEPLKNWDSIRLFFCLEISHRLIKITNKMMILKSSSRRKLSCCLKKEFWAYWNKIFNRIRMRILTRLLKEPGWLIILLWMDLTPFLRELLILDQRRKTFSWTIPSFGRRSSKTKKSLCKKYWNRFVSK